MQNVKRKIQSLGIWLLVVCFGLLVAGGTGCGKQEEGRWGGAPYTPVTVSGLFDVSGAKAILAASALTVSSAGVKALSGSASEILKLTTTGEIESIINLSASQRPPISAIEVGPDGSLYVGFRWGVWIPSSTREGEGEQVAFFRIKPNGSTEVVDRNIWSIGTWQGGDNSGELPVKQIQFDSEGNVYYLAQSSDGQTISLKKKATTGSISQIGNSSMWVRDFYVCPNGFVLFHGSNAGSWNREWLKLMYKTATKTIFYNTGNTGWLRAYYYIPANNSVMLIGENLEIEDQNNVSRRYSGIIRVKLDSSGTITEIKNLYDDNFIIDNDNWSTVGSQIVYGCWDPETVGRKSFFVETSSYNPVLPLSLEVGVTEEAIRNFVHGKFQTVTYESWGDFTFAGINFDYSSSEVIEGKTITNLQDKVDALISQHIKGKTWKQWKAENGLQGVQFGSAKQLVLAGDGQLLSVMRLDGWGSGVSTVKGDRLYRITDATGEASLTPFARHASYISIDKARYFGNYVVYISSRSGKSKILRADANVPTAEPTDMTATRSNVEIFSFDYDTANNKLIYDVYDNDTSTSYLVEQPIADPLTATEKAATGYTITDVVSFIASEEAQ